MAANVLSDRISFPPIVCGKFWLPPRLLVSLRRGQCAGVASADERLISNLCRPKKWRPFLERAARREEYGRHPRQILAGFMPGRIAGRARGRAIPLPKKRSRPPAKERAPEQDPIAVAILKARIRAGLTQQQLAERLRTDQGNIAWLERNRSQATVRTLKRVADATWHELVINFRRFSKSTYKIARAHSDSAGCVARITTRPAPDGIIDRQRRYQALDGIH